MKQYPKIPDNQMVDVYVAEGSDIDLLCEAERTQEVRFYYNGSLVKVIHGMLYMYRFYHL